MFNCECCKRPVAWSEMVLGSGALHPECAGMVLDTQQKIRAAVRRIKRERDKGARCVP